VALGATAGLIGAVGAIWGLAFGCSFPSYTTGDLNADGGDGGDGSVDTGPIDTGPVDTGPYILGDGRVCSGPDEDGDGVPDECDNCPNIPNPGLAGKDVGDACNSPLLNLGGLTTRLAWDPFHTFSTTSWNYFGPSDGAFALGPDNNSIIGGSTTDEPDGGGSSNLRFISGPIGASAGSSSVAVTAVISILAEGGSLPNAGVIARVDGASGKQFFLCGVGAVGYFRLLRTSGTGGTCDGGPCAVNAFNYDGGTGNTSQLPFPADVPHGLNDKIGIRITVTAGTGDGGVNPGDVECRVFNPNAPSTLLASDPKYAMKLTIAPSSRWIASGDVGAFASGSKLQIHSMDILKGP
jgi:hypothetical protein